MIAMLTFDLLKYWHLFGDALEARYDRKDRFQDGFARIEDHYKQFRLGRNRTDITAQDVLELFKGDLPYVNDWSKPDGEDLARQLADCRVAEAIRNLTPDTYSEKLISRIRYGFRDLGLMALVLHHVFPDRYAI